MTRDEIVAIMLAGMAQHGVRTDIMEHLTLGNPDWGTPPKGIYAALSALEVRGMVVVPKEATNKMIDAGGYALQEYADLTMDAAKAAWPAMLAARPEQE